MMNTHSRVLLNELLYFNDKLVSQDIHPPWVHLIYGLEKTMSQFKG